MGEVIDLESMHAIVNFCHEPMSSSSYYMDCQDQYCFDCIFFIVALETAMPFHKKRSASPGTIYLPVPYNDLPKACRAGQILELVHSLALCTFGLW